MATTVKCFVAIAFDKPDVDAIFDQAIRRVLRELSIQVLRVDRVEHNDDIDDKIFQLLDDADLCIADLTYARPSVYYEAGYAFASSKPVIYIARSDHLRANDKDQHGNFRVHFDLQMKNIIAWTEANDAFRQRLKKRLSKVVQPLLKAHAQEIVVSNQEAKFRLLSQLEQLRQITQAAVSCFPRAFRKFGDYPTEKSFVRTRRRIYQKATVLAVPTLKKERLMQALLQTPYRSEKVIPKEVDRYFQWIIIATLNSFRERSLANWLHNYRRISDKLFRVDYQKYFATGQDFTSVVAIIDNVRSADQFHQCLKRLIKESDFVSG